MHAAAFIRKREIVLEEALLANAPKFRLILVHELFHFVWAKLGNPARYEYARLLEAERQRGARGELGESSAVAKLKVRESRGLRDYICESFCDTGAWLYAGVVQHPEFRLKPRWCALRLDWFRKIFASGRAF